MAVLHLDQDSFDRAVSSGGVTLVDFWATWCGPCKMLAPVIDQLARDYEGKITVGKVDVDQEGELAARFGVMSIPTVILFKGGIEIERKVGVMPAEVYTALLDANV